MSDIAWRELEFLFIDLPAGTGDEPLSIIQLLPEMDGVVIVGTPSEVSQIVVKKAVTFSRKLNIPVIGVIENMSGFVCIKCGAKIEIFKVGGGEEIAEDLKVPFLGKVPIATQICEGSDRGTPLITKHIDFLATGAFMKIVKKIEGFLKTEKTQILKVMIEGD